MKLLSVLFLFLRKLLQASRRSKQIMDEEDLRFEQYTDACMNEWHTQGKSCKPMRITLGKKHSMAD